MEHKYKWEPLDISFEEFLMTFYEADDHIWFQILDDRSKMPDHPPFKGAKVEGISGKLEKKEKLLRKHNAENRGIFFFMNSGGSEQADINRINAHFMEIDDISFEEQIERIEKFDLEPSLIVKTQKSFHVYWLTKPGAKVDNFRYIQRQLVAYFGADAQNINANRVLRVPGFYHCKKEPVMVQCVKFNPELRYTQEELSAHLPDVEPEPETKVNGEPLKDRGTQKGFALVGARCNFIQHCKKNAATLSEPDWYAMISQLAVFEGGIEAIHALSKPYPKYSEAATNAKIAHFFSSGSNPQTCARICEHNGFNCPKYRDKSCRVKSPVVLSYYPADAAELVKFLKIAAFKSKGDAALDIETAHKFIDMYMFNITPAKAEVFINHNIKDHYKFSAKDIKPLIGFQKQLYSAFSSQAEARKIRQQDNVAEWYDTTSRGTLRYMPGVHADHLAEKVNAIYVGNDWYFYEDGYYAKKSVRRAQKYIRSEMISRYATKNDIQDTEFQWGLLIDKYTREINTNPYLINLGNCIFNTQTWQTQPHDPGILCTIRIGGNYDETAKCPMFLKYLSEVLPETEIPLIQEIMGYFLVPITKAQKCFVMLGGGDNGKSTLLYAVQDILLRGVENCSSLTWNELSDKFGTVLLYGKLANVFADLPNDKLRNTGTFKAITGEDNISAQQKYHEMFSFKTSARLLFSCQHLPPNYNDNSNGFYRRLIIVTFDRVIAEEKKDGDLKEKLLTEQDGILMWALEGLKRLMANKWKFTQTERTAEALEEYKAQNSSVLAFVQDCCIVHPDAECFREELYNAYKEYCDSSGYNEPFGLIKFNTEVDGVKGVVRGQKRTRNEKKADSVRRIWKGIKLK
jgi:putative DNA primase/helicase